MPTDGIASFRGGDQASGVIRVGREMERDDERAAAGLVSFKVDGDQQRAFEQASLNALQAREHFTARIDPDDGA